MGIATRSTSISIDIRGLFPKLGDPKQIISIGASNMERTIAIDNYII